jgi:hypothetical protein
MVALRKNIANVTNIIKWIRARIQKLLWTNDIDVFSVIHSFANEGYILKTKTSQVFTIHPVAKDMFTLKIKTSLTKDRSNESAIFDKWGNLFQNGMFSMSWGTNDNDISIRNYFRSTIRTNINLSN